MVQSIAPLPAPGGTDAHATHLPVLVLEVVLQLLHLLAARQRRHDVRQVTPVGSRVLGDQLDPDQGTEAAILNTNGVRSKKKK